MSKREKHDSINEILMNIGKKQEEILESYNEEDIDNDKELDQNEEYEEFTTFDDDEDDDEYDNIQLDKDDEEY